MLIMSLVFLTPTSMLSMVADIFFSFSFFSSILQQYLEGSDFDHYHVSEDFYTIVHIFYGVKTNQHASVASHHMNNITFLFVHFG